MKIDKTLIYLLLKPGGTISKQEFRHASSALFFLLAWHIATLVLKYYYDSLSIESLDNTDARIYWLNDFLQLKGMPTLFILLYSTYITVHKRLSDIKRSLKRIAFLPAIFIYAFYYVIILVFTEEFSISSVLPTRDYHDFMAYCFIPLFLIGGLSLLFLLLKNGKKKSVIFPVDDNAMTVPKFLHCSGLIITAFLSSSLLILMIGWTHVFELIHEQSQAYLFWFVMILLFAYFLYIAGKRVKNTGHSQILPWLFVSLFAIVMLLFYYVLESNISIIEMKLLSVLYSGIQIFFELCLVLLFITAPIPDQLSNTQEITE